MSITISEYKKNQRESRRQQGLCPECGGQREEPRWKLCKICRDIANYRRMKRVI